MKTKILLVATESSPGMIPFAATIINALAECPHFEVYCICVNAGKHSYLQSINQNAHPVFIEYPQNKLKKLLHKIWPAPIIRVLQQIDKEVKPRIIHFLTGDFTLANYIAQHPDKRYYYTVHDLHPHEVKRKSIIEHYHDKYLAYCTRRNINNIENLTTSSHSQLEELKHLRRDVHIDFTHFPTLVNQEIISGTKEVSELKGIQNYILFFGSIELYKGIDLLLEAYLDSSIKDRHKLVIAGNGSSFDELMKDKNIIRINRFIYNEELAYLFRNSAIVIYPYRSATMSGVLSLAFYFHKRVILSDIPFFKENNCTLTTFFQNGNPVDLKNKMQDLLNAETEERIYNDDCYDQIYSIKTLVADYMNLYEINK